MLQEEVLKLLRDCGAFLAGHFVLKSGKHSGQYVNKDAAYPDTEIIDMLCEEIAGRVGNLGIEVVIAPAVAGTVLANRVAAYLTAKSVPKRKVSAVYAEKQGSGFVVKRGYDLILRGKKCLVVEDVFTTGGTAKEVVKVVRAFGGEVVGVAGLVNRGGVTAEALGVPLLLALAEIEIETWLAEECPLCRDGVVVNTNVGHGSEFLAAMAGKLPE